MYAQAFSFTICGSRDERRLSFEKEVGRAIRPSAKMGCTITMVGKSCAISAGHCLNELKIAQFNTFINYRKELASRPEDTYEIDQKKIEGQNQGVGNDWSVFMIKKNKVTGLYPGDVQGRARFSLQRTLPSQLALTITGYGHKSLVHKEHSPQQSHTSRLVNLTGTVISYDVDTMGGNSGSAIQTNNGIILGVHTHGYCTEEGGTNQGTFLAMHDTFRAALARCFQSER